MLKRKNELPDSFKINGASYKHFFKFIEKHIQKVTETHFNETAIAQSTH